MANQSSKFKVQSAKSEYSSYPLIGSKGGNATSMAELMAKHKSSFVTLKKGESVKAKITKLTPSEILVDAGAKTEALVLEKEKRILNTILSTFKVGDTVEVNVLNPESESGQPMVSLRRYLGNLAWKKLEDLQKNKELIEVVVTDVTKAGYVAATEFGISGFLPMSHAPQKQDLQPGAKLQVTVLELNKKDNKVIFSQKTTFSSEEFNSIMQQFPVGQKVTGIVTNVTSFGIFVSLPLLKSEKEAIEGFIHISEASWDKVNDLSGMFSVGQKIEAVIVRFDEETQRINLSIKRLTADPFEELTAKFPVDKKVSGEVTKIDDTGVILSLVDGVEGFIRKEKIPPMTTYSVGQNVNVSVSEYDKKRRRIVLVPVLLEKPIGYR